MVLRRLAVYAAIMVIANSAHAASDSDGLFSPNRLQAISDVVIKVVQIWAGYRRTIRDSSDRHSSSSGFKD